MKSKQNEVGQKMSLLLKKIAIERWYSSLKLKYDNNENECELLTSSCKSCHSPRAFFYENQLKYLENENDMIYDLLDDIETFYKPFIT